MYKYKAEVIRQMNPEEGLYPTFLCIDLGFRQWHVINIHLDKKVEPKSSILIKTDVEKHRNGFERTHIYTGKVIDD